jgi:hypothetical protein
MSTKALLFRHSLAKNVPLLPQQIARRSKVSPRWTLEKVK